MRAIEQEQLDELAKQLETAFTKYLGLIAQDKVIKSDGENIAAQIRTALLNNNAFKLSYCKDKPELLEQFNVIKSIIARITIEGLKTDKLPKETVLNNPDDTIEAKVKATIRDHGVDACKLHCANVLAFNSLVVINHAFFDKHGVLKPFFIEFLSKITGLSRFTKYIWPGTEENRQVYQAITNALFMKFVHPIYALIAVETKDFSLASYLTNFTSQLFSPDSEINITVADLVCFTKNYTALGNALVEFVSTIKLKNTKKMLEIYNDPKLSVWQRVTQIFSLDEIKTSITKNDDLKSPANKIKKLASSTSEIANLAPAATTPKQQHSPRRSLSTTGLFGRLRLAKRINDRRSRSATAVLNPPDSSEKPASPASDSSGSSRVASPTKFG